MTTSATNVSRRPSPYVQPGSAVNVIGWLTAGWCVGFAVVNIVLESSAHLANSEYADHAAAFTVMNRLVAGLKLLGAAVALLSVAKRPPPLPPRLLGVMVWSAFATLAVYVLGGMAQGFGMALGLMGTTSEVDRADVSYLIFFLIAAGGWGVLSVSYSNRHALSWRPALLGVLGAPVLLGFVLVGMPALLTALGVMPRS